MTEKECEKSPDGKHHYTMYKSGMNPVYGCHYCLKARPKTTMCPNCGYPTHSDEGHIFDHI